MRISEANDKERQQIHPLCETDTGAKETLVQVRHTKCKLALVDQYFKELRNKNSPAAGRFPMGNTVTPVSCVTSGRCRDEAGQETTAQRLQRLRLQQ